MGNFLWKSRPVRAPRCAFFRQPSRSAPTFFGQRHSRAALRLQNSPARFLHGQPPYTNIALRCRRHCSTICGQPALPNAAMPPQLPRQSSTASAARPHAASIHFIQICREPSKSPAPYPRPGPRYARRSGSASPAMLPRPGHPAPAPVAGTAPHALPTSFRSK